MANPVIISLVLAASSANNIAQSQTPGGAGNLTLNGSAVSAGIATLDVARRVAIASASNISNRTFTITGTDRYGRTLTQTITGPNNATVYTDYDFKTVTQVSISGAAAGAVTVGTNGVGSTDWIHVSREISPVNITLALSLPAGAGTNASVEHTYDDPNAILGPNWGGVEPNSNIPPLVWQNATLGGVTISGEGAYTMPIFAYRLTINSGTGTATLQGIQAGLHG